MAELLNYLLKELLKDKLKTQNLLHNISCPILLSLNLNLLEVFYELCESISSMEGWSCNIISEVWSDATNVQVEAKHFN